MKAKIGLLLVGLTMPLTACFTSEGDSANAAESPTEVWIPGANYEIKGDTVQMLYPKSGCDKNGHYYTELDTGGRYVYKANQLLWMYQDYSDSSKWNVTDTLVGGSKIENALWANYHDDESGKDTSYNYFSQGKRFNVIPSLCMAGEELKDIQQGDSIQLGALIDRNSAKISGCSQLQYDALVQGKRIPVTQNHVLTLSGKVVVRYGLSVIANGKTCSASMDFDVDNWSEAKCQVAYSQYKAAKSGVIDTTSMDKDWYWEYRQNNEVQFDSCVTDVLGLPKETLNRLPRLNLGR